MKSSKNVSPNEKQQPEKPDVYQDASGRTIFSESYHLKRGYCCGEGCMHCPYDFEMVPEPRRTELKNRAASSKP